MKLSDIKTQLEKCDELGALGFWESGNVYGLNLPNLRFNWYLGIQAELEQYYEQALIIAALEQFALSKGYKPVYDWMENGNFILDMVEFIPLNSVKRRNTPSNSAEAENKLQASLEAFLAVERSEDESYQRNVE